MHKSSAWEHSHGEQFSASFLGCEAAFACHKPHINCAETAVIGCLLEGFQAGLWLILFYSERSGFMAARGWMSKQWSIKGTACTAQNFHVRESLIPHMCWCARHGVCVCVFVWATMWLVSSATALVFHSDSECLLHSCCSAKHWFTSVTANVLMRFGVYFT